MLVRRDSTDLFDRLGALRNCGKIIIQHEPDGWMVTITPTDGSNPIACTREDLRDAVVWMVNHCETWLRDCNESPARKKRPAVGPGVVGPP